MTIHTPTADPCRWLESDNDRVRGWQQQQANRAQHSVRSWPHYQRLVDSVEYYSQAKSITIPQYANGYWFWAERGALWVSEVLYQGGKAITLAPDKQSDGAAAVISWFSPSPNAEVLAVGLSMDASEANRISVVSVATGKPLAGPLPQVLMDNWMGACWLPDSSGFYFTALEGDRRDLINRVYFHSMVTSSQTLVDIPLASADLHDCILITLSPQGHYLVATSGMVKPKPVAIKALDSNEGWRPFITTIDELVVGHIWNNAFIAITYINAPRGRVVSIPLDSPDPNHAHNWSELVAESDAVIRTLTPVGEHLYINQLVDCYARVRIVDRAGKAMGEVPLPGNGALMDGVYPINGLVPKGHPEEYWFVYSSLIESKGLYRHRPGETSIDVIQAPTITVDNAVVELHWAISADGEKVPYQQVRLTTVDPTEPQPTLIQGYGGFNAVFKPRFIDAVAAFVAAGGVYIHAHLRGGGEFGLDWWQGGRLKQKQNSYNDLYAIAEKLIDTGCTTATQLAVTGRSCGGLMAGVALTQRPDLWQAVVPQFPRLDLIGSLDDPYARRSTRDDYANPDDPDELKRLATFSPYQLIKEGQAYPSTLVIAGDLDPRCRAFHARKFAACLQAANNANTKVFVHVWENAGHFGGEGKAAHILEVSEWLAFVMRELEMVPALMAPVHPLECN